jgi:hypothetical protein
MISANLPKILFRVFYAVSVVSIIGLIFGGIGFFIFYYFSLVVSPISIILLIIWKFFNKKIKNEYFVIVLVINIILFIIFLYMTLHALDNFMSLS